MSYLASRSPAIPRSTYLITKSHSLGRGCSQYSRDDHIPNHCSANHTTTGRVKATSSPFLYIGLDYILLSCLFTSYDMKSNISRSQVLDRKSVSKRLSRHRCAHRHSNSGKGPNRANDGDGERSAWMGCSGKRGGERDRDGGSPGQL